MDNWMKIADEAAKKLADRVEQDKLHETDIDQGVKLLQFYALMAIAEQISLLER